MKRDKPDRPHAARPTTGKPPRRSTNHTPRPHGTAPHSSKPYASKPFAKPRRAPEPEVRGVEIHPETAEVRAAVPPATRAPGPRKPTLQLQTTTLWEYPSQHYGEHMQGDQNYVGATPSWVIWNLLERYTKPGDLVVDPMCGSGTTIDVARDLGRRALGYDVAPYRPDIFRVDARKLPLESEKADFVFVDPPYSTHVDYSESPQCIGKLDALDETYYDAMRLAIGEMHRILRPGHHMALYVCDSWRNKKPFCPIGFRLFAILCEYFEPIDVIAVVRHNKTLKKHHYHTEAARGNFFLRGFNYLFIMRKANEAPPVSKAPRGPRAPRPPHKPRR